MKWLQWMAAVAATVMTAPPAVAQEAQAWTLPRLVAHALVHEPQLDAARLSAQAAQNEIQQAGRWSNPRVTLDHRREFGGMDRQTTGMAEFPLDWGRRGARVARGRHREQSDFLRRAGGSLSADAARYVHSHGGRRKSLRRADAR